MLKASVWPSYGAGNKRSIIEDNHRDNIQRRLRLIPTTKMKMIIKEATTIQTTTEEGTTTTRREKDVSRRPLRNQQTSLARTSTRRRRSFILRTQVSTNFQSAGSFWSR
jgi:hypothetical protein